MSCPWQPPGVERPVICQPAAVRPICSATSSSAAGDPLQNELQNISKFKINAAPPFQSSTESFLGRPPSCLAPHSKKQPDCLQSLDQQLLSYLLRHRGLSFTTQLCCYASCKILRHITHMSMDLSMMSSYSGATRLSTDDATGSGIPPPCKESPPAMPISSCATGTSHLRCNLQDII